MMRVIAAWLVASACAAAALMGVALLAWRLRDLVVDESGAVLPMALGGLVAMAVCPAVRIAVFGALMERFEPSEPAASGRP